MGVKICKSETSNMNFRSKTMLIILTSCIILQAIAQEEFNYYEEPQANSVEFGSPSEPTPPPSPLFWWMSSPGSPFNSSRKPSATLENSASGHQERYDYDSRTRNPPVRAMRCEYRPSKHSEYPLHCQFLPASSEKF